jgi:hypothetical protein
VKCAGHPPPFLSLVPLYSHLHLDPPRRFHASQSIAPTVPPLNVPLISTPPQVTGAAPAPPATSNQPVAIVLSVASRHLPPPLSKHELQNNILDIDQGTYLPYLTLPTTTVPGPRNRPARYLLKETNYYNRSTTKPLSVLHKLPQLFPSSHSSPIFGSWFTSKPCFAPSIPGSPAQFSPVQSPQNRPRGSAPPQ